MASRPTSSTYRLGAVASLNFLAIEKMPRITVKLRICRLGNAWRAALVAILPDNCHPSSYSLFLLNISSIFNVYSKDKVL